MIKLNSIIKVSYREPFILVSINHNMGEVGDSGMIENLKTNTSVNLNREEGTWLRRKM